MYKAKIKDIVKDRHQAKNKDFLRVEFDIIDGEENILESKKIGMEIGTSTEEIEKEVNKHIAEYGREVENRKQNEKREKEEKNFKEAKGKLIGKTIGGEVKATE